MKCYNGLFYSFNEVNLSSTVLCSTAESLCYSSAVHGGGTDVVQFGCWDPSNDGGVLQFAADQVKDAVVLY